MTQKMEKIRLEPQWDWRCRPWPAPRDEGPAPREEGPASERTSSGTLAVEADAPNEPLPGGEGPRRYRCRFVRAGRVRAAGNRPGKLEITPQALETAWHKGLFEGKAVFIDHAGFFEYPSLHNLVGVTVQTTYNALEQSVEGLIELFQNRAAQEITPLLQTRPHGPDVGLSIVFWPQVQASADGETQQVVAIDHVESVDLVFEPAADGRVLEALAAFACAVKDSTLDPDGGNTMSEENQEVRQENGLGPESQPEADLTAAPERKQAGEWLAAMGQAAALTMIAQSGLPQPSRKRLEAQRFSNPQEVTAAIECERQYLAELQQDQVIQMGGPAPRSPQVSGLRTGVDQIGEALESLLEGRRPAHAQPLSGIRELYHLLSGDFEMNGMFHSERVYLANVNSSTMSNLVANALNKRVVNEFMQYPQWWAPIVTEETYASLQSVKWITLGGVGELPTVAEGAAYTELTWDDAVETASFVKKGGYLGLTLEAIDKDDTGRLRTAPRALAQSAYLSQSKVVSGVFSENAGVGPTLSDGLALFHSTHANLGSTALSITSYAAARTAMRKQTEVNSSERLGALTAPKFLLVPPDLEITAVQVLASQYDYSYTLANGQAAPENFFAEGEGRDARLALARQRVIVVDLWTDTNNWAAAADPRLYPTIGIGYRYGRTPEIFSVASPTSGLMFTNDTMPIKVRFFFAVGPMDYRGLYKANV